MKLKTDANALLTAAAFGTATFMMMMVNQSGEKATIQDADNMDRVARSSGFDDEGQQQLGECEDFRLDGEDCSDNNSEEADDVSMFSEENGEGRKRGRKLFTIKTWESDSKKFNQLLSGLQKKQSAALKKKSPKSAPMDFSSAFEPPIVPSGSPWFDGDFADYNSICERGNVDMNSNNFLRSFNIYYPQELIYDASVDQMDLWNAYMDFNSRLSYQVASNSNPKSAIVLQGYRGSVMQRPYKFNAKDAQSTSNRQWAKQISSAYGILEEQGFMVPARRGKASTMVMSQPRFKSFNDYWTNRHKSAKIKDMSTNEETCVTVLIMHQAFFDASTLDNWVADGRGRQQMQANANYNQCVVIPVFIAPAGMEDWMLSTVTGLVPATYKYAQLHEDKKMYHVMTPEEFINDPEGVADNIAQWACVWNNRAQCYSTADPFTFAPPELERGLTSEATTTQAETTTTAWTSTDGTTTSPYAETTVSGFDATTTEGTTSAQLLNYCCFGIIDSMYGTIESCPAEMPEE